MKYYYTGSGILPKDEYLAHFGILGMRWGIRRFQNADGSLTSAGIKRYRKDNPDSAIKPKVTSQQQSDVHKVFSGAAYDEDVSRKVFDVIGADKNAIKRAQAEIDKCMNIEREITSEINKMFSGITEDEAEENYYDAVSEIASWSDYKNIDDLLISDIGDLAYHGIYGDGQQSIINAYSMYAYKNNLEQDVKGLSKKIDQIREIRTNAKSILTEAINDAGGEDLTISPTSKYSVGGHLIDHMYNASEKKNRNNTMGSYYLFQASHAQDFTSGVKDSIARAEKIAAKVNNNRDATNWYFLSMAAENLGLDDKKASELSQSDWDRINAEIRELRSMEKALW